jgi:hypothetical protein
MQERIKRTFDFAIWLLRNAVLTLQWISVTGGFLPGSFGRDYLGVRLPRKLRQSGRDIRISLQ